MIAQLYLKRKTKLDKPFDYEIPQNVKVEKFSLVEVELGTTKTTGLIWDFKKTSAYKLKTITKILSAGPVFTPSQIELARLISNEYLSTFGEAIFSFIPKLNLRDLKTIGFKAIKKSQRKQENLLFIGESSQRFLLFCQKIELGQNLAVFPTIYRVEEAVRAIAKLNPRLTVYSWHSKLKSHQKAKIWQELLTGEDITIIGTRHSLFLPFVSLKSVYIDEPTNFAYQEDQAPYYNAYKVARFLAKAFYANLIVGETSPDMLSFVALSKRQLKLQEIKPRLVFEIHSSWQDFVKEKSRSKEILNPNSKICVVGPWKNQTRLQCQDCKSEITCLKCQNQFFEENTYLCTKCKKIHLRSTCPKCASTNIQKVGFLYSKIIDDLKKIFPRSSITANAKAFFRSQIAVTSINELDYLQPIYEIALVPYFGDMIDFPYLNFREKLFEKIWGLNSAAVRKIHLFGTDLERNGFTKYLTENNWPTFLKEEMEERARLKLPPFSKSVMLVAKCSKPETCEKARDAILKQLKTKVEVYNYSQSFKAGRFFQKTLLTFPHKNWQQYKKILINSSTNIHFEVDPIEFG